MRLTDSVKWRSSSPFALTVTPGKDDEPSGAGKVQLHCTLSNDAGLAVGVVLAMLKDGKGVM